jgi:GT2 family glycosyltransferase
MPRKPDLSILIVNWNSAKYVISCLESLRRQVRGISWEAIIVDNASYDGVGELLQRGFPEATFVQRERNAGFASANNLAFSHARADRILILNPDVEVLQGAVSAMFDIIDQDPGVGAVGCRVLNSDRTTQWAYIHGPTTILTELMDIELLRRAFPRWQAWGARDVLRSPNDTVNVVALSGSCLLLRRDVFERVGGFDERFYMYSEDVDLCYRLRAAGYSIKYVGSESIIHFGGASEAFRSEHEFAGIMQRESRYRFFVKTRGRAYAFCYRGLFGVAALVRVMGITVISPVIAARLGTRAVTGTVARWWRIARWCFGGERWAATAGAPPGNSRVPVLQQT